MLRQQPEPCSGGWQVRRPRHPLAAERACRPALFGGRRGRHSLHRRQSAGSNRRAAQRIQEHRHHRVGDRDCRRHRNPDGFAVHEAEEGQHRAGERKGRGLDELLLDDEGGNRAKNEASENGAAAEHGETLIKHADLAELGHADLGGAGAGGGERAVDQRLAPGREMRHQRQHDRRRVALRRLLERLRADQHADVEQDRRDRDHRERATASAR